MRLVVCAEIALCQISAVYFCNNLCFMAQTGFVSEQGPSNQVSTTIGTLSAYPLWGNVTRQACHTWHVRHYGNVQADVGVNRSASLTVKKAAST